MIYFTSDTHFCHKNIIKYCNRPFENVEQMNEALIRNWNNIVLPGDTIYHLGDYALGRKEDIQEITKKLNGKKYLIRGNHDNLSAKAYEELGFIVLKNGPIKLEEYFLLLSHVPVPNKQIPKGYINLHGHIHDKTLEQCYEAYEPKLYSPLKHINLSCDVTDYMPISLDEIKSGIKDYKNRLEK